MNVAGLNECAEVRTCVFLPDEEGGHMSQTRRKNRGGRIKNIRWSGDAGRMLLRAGQGVPA